MKFRVFLRLVYLQRKTESHATDGRRDFDPNTDLEHIFNNVKKVDISIAWRKPLGERSVLLKRLSRLPVAKTIVNACEMKESEC